MALFWELTSPSIYLHGDAVYNTIKKLVAW